MPAIFRILLAAMSLTAGIGVLGRVRAEPIVVPSAAGLEKLSGFFEDEVASGKIAGAVVLIQQHGSPVYLKCFGNRDPVTKTPMTPDTVFALHSMTKPITSLAAMMLIDEGKLSLTDPLSKYIPAFAAAKVAVVSGAKDRAPGVTLTLPDRAPDIEDLLRHTSGISNGYIGAKATREIYEAARIYDGQFDNRIFAERIARLPLVAQPGTLWRYGHSIDVLGRIIEIVSGKSLYQFLKLRIFDPLGMSSTTFRPEDRAEQQRMAKPFSDDGFLQTEESERLANPGWESGGAGLFSTITDYARFAQMLLDRGRLDDRRYLSETAFRQMTSDHVGPGSGVARDYFYFPGDGFGFGYGLAVRTDPGLAKPPPPGSLGELKWDSAAGTYVGIDPKLDMIYILMEQTDRERGHIIPAFRQLVYDAFKPDDGRMP
jgi:CubicO group peptidase (beta-lactamase class C family)